ncbi:MAG: amphi-Trp domain-containing protein [Desulfovibrionaceae bacterium]|nr:amphi-Trp domain-containing protein [Desulfovibrionaceae bacterium]MBF0513760.1 amphi-Trp domain-containing protein [Desulfovibrionaceae bacterium]
MGSKVKLEGVMELREAIARIEAMSEGMKAGEVKLADDKETLVLHPARVVAVEFKAGQKKDKEKISLEISWKIVP